MAMIYDLDNEYGGKIISDSNSPGPALTVEGGVATLPALTVGRTGVSSATVAPLKINHPSAASAPVLEFGHFASITSIILTSVANTDYAIRVKVGDTYRWIPLWKDAGVIGAAAF